MSENDENNPSLSEAINRLEAGNANQALLSNMLAEITRRLMRASTRYDHSHVYDAAHDLAFLIKTAQMTKELNTFDVVKGAIDQLSVEENYSSLSYPDVHLAEIATQYLIEKSSTGGYSHARQRKSQERLQSAVKRYGEEVQWRIEDLKKR